MNRSYLAIAALALIASARFGPSLAAPPTVVPSPGYDARLQEQRKAAGASAPAVQAPGAGPVLRPPAKRKHRHAH
jgi:hypothetical protein